MKCRLCLEKKKLVKAHAIPEAFFIAVNPDRKKPSKLITNHPDQYPKKSPIGVYDQNILCSECEAIFGVYDDYAISVFRDKKITFKDVIFNGHIVGYLIRPDYKKLKFFFLSVLWRAAVSTHEYYSHVELGPHIEKLRVLVKNQTETTPGLYPVLLTKFNEEPEIVPMLGPWRTKVECAWHYHFVFLGYEATIRVGSHSLSSELRKHILSPDKDMQIMFKEYKGSNYYSLLLDIAKLQREGLFNL
jgi:hypothetical protein